MPDWGERLRSGIGKATGRPSGIDTYQGLRSMAFGVDPGTIAVPVGEPWSGAAMAAMEIGLNNAIALPRVWAFNMPVHYKRFADIAEAMGVDRHGMTDVQAAEAALGAAIRLLRDVGIPEKFVEQDVAVRHHAGGKEFGFPGGGRRGS